MTLVPPSSHMHELASVKLLHGGGSDSDGKEEGGSKEGDGGGAGADAKLAEDAAASLRRAADRSRKSFTLEADTLLARDTAGLMARRMNSLSEEEREIVGCVLRKLHNERSQPYQVVYAVLCELAGVTRKRSQCSKQCESTRKKRTYIEAG